MFDLLAPHEDVGMSNRFNTALLAAWLLVATRWVEDYARQRGLRIGYFGASTGVAAAIRAASDPQLLSPIDALVCRGGRVDLTGLEVLQRLAAPTLMIVSADDVDVVKLNQLASGHMQCEWKIDLVPGASHLFEDPAALEDVAGRAALWFSQHLGTARQK
ncbi:dienelactone hydrolase family protein [Cupriavidus sp. USMAHM13]|uniref:dienelactone hydrolase family protein n=1 Tax=Cupriavidus sp. USMAHM13 TaxID=1389192 RepID=UPI001E420F6C|nr:alpha/beta hydrolase [Cupriavidus sp. USMAHM13]